MISFFQKSSISSNLLEMKIFRSNLERLLRLNLPYLCNLENSKKFLETPFFEILITIFFSGIEYHVCKFRRHILLIVCWTVFIFRTLTLILILRLFKSQ